MTSEKMVQVLASLGDAGRLKIFEMLMNGKTCACKIGEKFDLDNAGVKKMVSPMVKAGLVDVQEGKEWDVYSINETQMCLLNKYFNLNLQFV